MNKSILIVDDTETVLLFTKTLLKGTGAVLRTAKNGRQALDSVKASRPDLILLDIMMPELNGIETCRLLKNDSATQGIPVIMVTTKGEANMVEQAYQAGCDDFVTKPINKTELLNKVSTYLR